MVDDILSKSQTLDRNRDYTEAEVVSMLESEIIIEIMYDIANGIDASDQNSYFAQHNDEFMQTLLTEKVDEAIASVSQTFVQSPRFIEMLTDAGFVSGTDFNADGSLTEEQLKAIATNEDFKFPSIINGRVSELRGVINIPTSGEIADPALRSAYEAMIADPTAKAL